jgi:hypothetical protein
MGPAFDSYQVKMLDFLVIFTYAQIILSTQRLYFIGRCYRLEGLGMGSWTKFLQFSRPVMGFKQPLTQWVLIIPGGKEAAKKN